MYYEPAVYGFVLRCGSIKHRNDYVTLGTLSMIIMLVSTINKEWLIYFSITKAHLDIWEKKPLNYGLSLKLNLIC